VTDASHFPFRVEAPSARLGVALVASTALHWCVAGVLLPEAPRRPGSEQVMPAISAQLAVAEAAVEPPAPMPRSPKGPAPQQHGQAEVAVPPRPASELAYYSATELDAFPRLLAPLDLHRLGNPAGRIRAVVKIDELGLVKEVEIAGTDSRTREVLRALLSAARFAPALRDERPVRSRVVLDFSFAGY
jgi:hypothetical protein